jgi:hypothetical protein
LVIISEDRFHLALIPLFSILAAFFWMGGWQALKMRWETRNGKIAIVLATFTVLLLCTNWSLELWREADKLALLLGSSGNQTYFSY